MSRCKGTCQARRERLPRSCPPRRPIQSIPSLFLHLSCLCFPMLIPRDEGGKVTPHIIQPYLFVERSHMHPAFKPAQIRLTNSRHLLTCYREIVRLCHPWRRPRGAMAAVPPLLCAPGWVAPRESFKTSTTDSRNHCACQR